MTIPGWNSLHIVEAVAHWSHILALIFVAFMVVAEILSFVYDSRKDTLVIEAQRVAARSRGQQDNESKNRYESDLAAAKAAMFSANDELAQLREQRAPRHLSAAEEREIFRTIAPFKGQKVKITSNAGDRESDSFASKFYELVTKAEWDCENNPGQFEVVFAGGTPLGIEVTLNLADVKARHVPPATAEAYNALMEVLHKTGLVKENAPAFASDGVPSGKIEVRIGSKPVRPGETISDVHPERTQPLSK